MQADVDMRIQVAQFGNGYRQHITSLGVGCCNGQGAAVLRAVLLADAFQVANFTQDDFDAFEYLLTWLRDPLQPFAVSSEDVDTQLML